MKDKKTMNKRISSLADWKHHIIEEIDNIEDSGKYYMYDFENDINSETDDYENLNKT